MHIAVLGSSPLAEPLVQLAERADETVSWMQAVGAPLPADRAADLVILAGSPAAVEPLLASIAESVARDVVIVDATTPTQEKRDDDGAARPESRSGWIARALPRVPVVRAFASVPAEALATLLDAPASQQAGRLAVPLAGDDRNAKAVVESFMRDIGVDPFDLGASGTADALDPGGALWGKALSSVEMLEAVGRLSGDG
jgi:8-hydroxy-5-deazaflavin:NADPH oxidoreductase